MAIGTPVELGSHVGTTNSVITTANDSPAGNCIVVFAIDSSRTITGVTDSAGNTYTSSGVTSAGNLSMWTSPNALHLPSGGTITISSQVNLGAHVMGYAVSVSGIATTTPVDIAPAVVPGGPSTTPSKSTGTLSQASEIVFGVVTCATGTGFTEASGFSTDGQVTNWPGNSRDFHFAYQIVNATTSVTYAPTL